MRGYVEHGSHTHVSGWAFDESAPERRVRLAIYDGDTCLALVTADRYRQDLANTLGTDGRHGFHISFPKDLFPLPVHALSVFVQEQGTHLGGSPCLVRHPEGGDVGAWLQGRAEGLANAARVAGDLDNAVSIFANALNAVMARREALLQRQFGVGDEATPAQQLLADLPDFLKDSLARLLKQHRPAWLPTTKAPALSIVVALHGRIGTLIDLLNSVLEHRPSVPFEVIVVDGSGQAETVLAPFLFGGGLRYFRVSAGSATTQLWAQGARLSRSDTLFFLDDTMRLRQGAANTLFDTLKAQPAPCLIAPRLSSQDGRMLEAGADVGPLGQRLPRGYGAAPSDPVYARLVETNDIASGAVMMSRAAYLALKGFSETVNLGSLGTLEAVMRARRNGLKVFTQGCAVMTTTGQRMDFDSASEASRRAFAVQYAGDCAALEGARMRSRPRALFIDSVWPDPNRDAASQVTISHARALEALGYAVEFSAFETIGEQGNPERIALEYGLEAYGPAVFADPIAHIEARKNAVDLVYVHRVAAAESVIPAVRKHCPNARVLFNVADLHFIRRGREADIIENDSIRAGIEALRENEIAAIRSSDIVITHSEPEAQLIRELVPEAAVHVVGWPFPPIHVPTPFAKRKHIAFIGGYKHSPNVDAVVYFARNVFPALRERLPEVELHLIGSHVPPEVSALAGDGVRVHGYVKDLRKALAELRLTIAPLRFGAGIKGKVLMSFAAGLPCIMSPMAAEGLPLDDELAALKAETSEQWVDTIAALYKEEDRWKTMSKRGLALVAQRYSEAAVSEELHKALNTPSKPVTAVLTHEMPSPESSAPETTTPDATPVQDNVNAAQAS